MKPKSVFFPPSHTLLVILLKFWCCPCVCRHIQDPASQRLTWNKPPKSVLVIKKIQDASLLEPFKELCIFLTKVRPNAGALKANLALTCA